MEWVLKYYTRGNDLVLDPAMGSGSTGAARFLSFFFNPAEEAPGTNIPAENILASAIDAFSVEATLLTATSSLAHRACEVVS